MYLLAAGRGTRAGGPKAWLQHEGKALLARQFDFLLKRFPPMRVAVSVQEEWLAKCRALHPLVQWVPVDPDAPVLTSLLALVRAVPLDSWAFLYHVDMPVWEDELWYLLSSHRPADAADAAEAVVPMHGGRGGHPVLLSPALADQLGALDPARDRLDVWLRGRRVKRVEVPYSCVVENWNGGARG